MSDTDIQIIRRYDNDGLLEAAGVSWNEMCRPVLMAFVFPLFVLIFTTAASGFFMLAKGFPLKLVLLFGASVIALLLARKLLHRLGWQRRSVVFLRDRTIETPHGLHSNPSCRTLSFGHDELSSVEKRFFREIGREREFFVDLMSREGDWVTVADGLSETDSHRVTVQLTKALREIRDVSFRATGRSFTAEDALRMAAATMAHAPAGETIDIGIVIE